VIGQDFAGVRRGDTAPPLERRPTAVDLFQMSATLGIAHRIHYDAPYTTAVEGHPGLLVQGPLQASYLVQTVREAVGAPVRLVSFRFRHLAPAYVDEPIRCEASVTQVEEQTRTATFEVTSFNADGIKLTVGELIVAWP